MSNYRKALVLAVAAFCLVAVASVSAQQDQPVYPVGSITFETTSIAAGLGVSWGNGTFSFQGQQYPIKIEGLWLASVGISMPQKQIFLISKGPKVYYVYADASGCGCLYGGNQQNYQNFQSLLSQSQIAAEQYQAAQMAEWDWGTWGPGWWGETGVMQ
jgi:hypothetical protein